MRRLRFKLGTRPNNSGLDRRSFAIYLCFLLYGARLHRCFLRVIASLLALSLPL